MFPTWLNHPELLTQTLKIKICKNTHMLSSVHKPQGGILQAVPSDIPFPVDRRPETGQYLGMVTFHTQQFPTTAPQKLRKGRQKEA